MPADPGSGRTDAFAPVTSSHAEAVLACRRQQTHPNDCGPFAAAAVITGLTGQQIVAEELAQALDRPRGRGLWGLLPLVRRVPRFATFPWGVVDALRLHGLEARWQAGMSPEDLVEHLAEGDLLVPIIGRWLPKPWAHYMVLLAHNPAIGWGFADPASRYDSLRWYPAEDFLPKWRNMGRMAVIISTAERDRAAGGGPGGGLE